ncbi:universal stress protein family protein [Klebsormidium nitens]|uniref:Universal stress protein family protein n=1 Tax=Klebsormidium nitens TaxID=105231 RepID=A0A1Y1HN69_KLENI|nr:universal stress protein family protein [Klebsormidium nitens]|eukprot:GAQ80080.1 universal stress protein family protein [Klebsormidium nitens]
MEPAAQDQPKLGAETAPPTSPKPSETPQAEPAERHILCAFDGSLGARSAFEFARDKIASRERGDDLVLFQAFESLYPPGFFDTVSEGTRRTLQEQEGRRLTEAVNELHKLAGTSGSVPCTFAVVAGDPRSELLKHLNSHPVDLVVMGSRGLNPMSRLFLGSVSNHVVHNSPVPVVVVPTASDPVGGLAASLRRGLTVEESSANP